MHTSVSINLLILSFHTHTFVKTKICKRWIRSVPQRNLPISEHTHTHTKYHSDTLRTEQSMSKQLSDPRASMDPILRKAADADESQSDA